MFQRVLSCLFAIYVQLSFAKDDYFLFLNEAHGNITEGKENVSVQNDFKLNLYNKYIERAENITRKGNVDVFFSEEESREIGVCHIPFLIPLSIDDNQKVTYQTYVAALLAIQHLNAGDGSVIQEIKEIRDKCNIYFTIEEIDTNGSKAVAVNHVIDLLENRSRLPCAFIGAYYSRVSIPTAIFTGIKGYAQMSYISTSSTLDKKSLFPLFSRVIPSDSSTSIPLIKYLNERLNVEHIAIIYVNDDYGTTYMNGIEEAIVIHAPYMKIYPVSIPIDVNPEIYRQAISSLKETQYRYFFAICFNHHYEPIMEEAVKQGIAGTGKHNWLFSDGISPHVLKDRDYVRGSPLYNSTIGVSIISASGGSRGMPVYDKFVNAFEDLNNEETVKYLNSTFASYSNLTIDDEFFEPDDRANFAYDSTIALGLAACSASKTNHYTYFDDGQAHYNAILNTSFEGASGNISLNPLTGTRDTDSVLFTIFNFVEDDKSKEEKSDIVKFTFVESDIFQNGDWTSIEPHIFNDGTSTVPLDLPKQTVEMNYIGTPVRATCLGMSTLIILLSVGLIIWTNKLKDAPVIKASQPIFLNIICYGTILMATSIISRSLDDEIVSINGMHIACMSTPWLLFLGFCLSFSALLAKTMRVNKIFHNPSLRRITVTKWEVMKPLLLLMGVNVLILSLWTSLSPDTWKRNIVATDGFNRVSEETGKCYIGSFVFLALLFFINICSVCLAIYEAYKARNVATEFAESKYIFITLISIVQVCFIGCPVMVIAYRNLKAFVFVYSGIIFVMCLSLLLLIFLPKIMLRNKTDLREAIMKSSQ